MDRFEIAQFYMVFGGIPYYLKLLDRGESLAQNVDRLLFSEDGELRNEFHNLYHALFRNSEKYIAIVEVLAQKKKGITRNTLFLYAFLFQISRKTDEGPPQPMATNPAKT